MLQLQGSTYVMRGRFERCHSMTRLFAPQTLRMHDPAAVATLLRELGPKQEPPRRMPEEEMRAQLQAFLLDGGE